LSGLSGAVVNVVKEHATSVLQVLNHDGIAIDPSSYPLTSRLPRPESFPLLIRAQKIPYIEHDLHVMMKRRLEEAQLQVYISPMAKANLQAPDDELFPLMENVQEFLASDRQVMLILGDSGSGKSTFNRRLERLLCTEYKRGGPIPLFINLAAIDNPQQDMVSKQLQFYNFNDDQILELKSHRQLVLICDGYDESQLMVNLHRTNFLNQPGQWNTKMIISCRTQYLGQSYLDRFRPQPTDRYKMAPQGVFQEAVIAPFSKEQIQDYVEKYVPLEPRTLCTHNYMYMLTTIPNLMDLVRNPFLLLLALEALPDIIKDKQDLSTIKIVRVQLYDTFVNHWLNVNKRRLRSNTLSREDYDILEQLEEAGFTAMGVDYSTRLASAMYNYQNGKPIVKYVHLKDKTTWRVKFFGPDPEVRLLREASPLTRSGSYYQFLHRSMLDYFFSCTVVGSNHPEHENKVDPPVVLDSSDIHSLDPDCPLFTHNLLTEPSVVQFLSERVQENSDFKRQLLEVVEKSKSDTSMATAAANAMTILVRAGVTFHRYDFRYICIPGADLSGGQFDSAQFQGADLTNVNLGMSWLRKADFSNAQMQGVQFGELPYLREDKAVRACLHSPDGKMLAVGLGDGSVTVYSTSSWRQIVKLSGHTDYTKTLAFSPDSQRLVTGSEDSRMWIWDCSNGDALLFLGGHTAGVTSVAYSPCGKQVVSASWDGTVRLWDTTTGDALFVLEGHIGSVNGVRFTADGRRLVSGSHDGTIRFWDAETGVAGDVWEPNYGRVQCLAISPDGRHVASGHGDGTLRLWNTSTGLADFDLRGHTNIIMSVMFSANGQQIASAAFDSTVRLWDSLAGIPIAVFSSPSPIIDVSFAPNGLQLASAGVLDKIHLWDVRSIRSSAGHQAHLNFVRTVIYLPTGPSIVSGGLEGTICYWDASTGAAESSHALSTRMTKSIALSSDGMQAAFCINDTIQLRNLQTGEPGPVLEGHTKDVTGLAYSPCGQWITSISDDKTVRLWDLRNIEQAHILATMNCGGGYGISNVTFSPTGLQIAVGDMNGTVNVYDTQLRKPLATTTLKGVQGPAQFSLLELDTQVRALAYSPNGQELAIGVVGGLFFWDLQSEKPGHRVGVDLPGVCSIAYSPCEGWIACGCLESVQLCRRQSSSMEPWCHVFAVEGFLGAVAHIAWNPVVPLEFVTGCSDRSVRIWRISESNDGGGAVSVDLIWGTNIGVLGAFGMVLGGVVGLNATSRKLLIQRGAIDDSLTYQEYEVDADSSGY
ncbi:Target of rapamycin complex subunit lst8, partial [Linnemannia gamsii]